MNIQIIIITIILILIAIQCTGFVLGNSWGIGEDSKVYRLSDYVRHGGGFESFITRKVYAEHNRSTIVWKYSQLTDTPRDINALTKIVNDYDTENIHCAIHVRLGDVIDNHSRSVHDFLHNPDVYIKKPDVVDTLGGESWVGHDCNMEECHSEGYVKNIKYFEDKLDKAVNIHNIVLISGSHKPTKHPEKSQEYLKELRTVLERRYNVSVRWNENADEDFALLSKAKNLILTGGGFSQLAGEVVKNRGGVVL